MVRDIRKCTVDGSLHEVQGGRRLTSSSPATINHEMQSNSVNIFSAHWRYPALLERVPLETGAYTHKRSLWGILSTLRSVGGACEAEPRFEVTLRCWILWDLCKFIVINERYHGNKLVNLAGLRWENFHKEMLTLMLTLVWKYATLLIHCRVEGVICVSRPLVCIR